MTETTRTNARLTDEQLHKLQAMDPGEVVILKGFQRQTVAYHVKKLPGSFNLFQCGPDVRIDRLGWQYRSKRRGNPDNLTHPPALGDKTKKR